MSNACRPCYELCGCFFFILESCNSLKIVCLLGKYRKELRPKQFYCAITWQPRYTCLPNLCDVSFISAILNEETGKIQVFYSYKHLLQFSNSRAFHACSRAGARELAGLTPRAGPVRPEPVLSVLRTDAFHLRTVQTDRSVLTNGKRS